MSISCYARPRAPASPCRAPISSARCSRPRSTPATDARTSPRSERLYGTAPASPEQSGNRSSGGERPKAEVELPVGEREPGDRQWRDGRSARSAGRIEIEAQETARTTGSDLHHRVRGCAVDRVTKAVDAAGERHLRRLVEPS